MPYTQDYPFSVTSNSTPSGSVGGIPIFGMALPESNSRSVAFIQNVGSGSPLYVSFGAPASTGNFHKILAAATTDFGGNGGVMEETQWRGAVFVSGSTRFISWQA